LLPIFLFLFCFILDVPETPTNINLTSITYSSISLKWQPGFDGGWPQTFLISLDNLSLKEINESYYTFSSKMKIEKKIFFFVIF